MSDKSFKEELQHTKGLAKRIFNLADEFRSSSLQSKISQPNYLISMGIYYPTPEPMLDAGIKMLQDVKAEKGRLSSPGGYWNPMGRELSTHLLAERIAEKLKVENKVSVDPYEEILVTNGVSPGMSMVPMMLCNPGDEVLITEPDYGPMRIAKVWGGKLVSVPLKERKGVLDETRWYFDPKELESRITEKSKLFMFSNPNNPLGYVYSKNDLEAIAKITKKHDLFVLTNECYERIVLSDEFYQTLVFESLAALPGMMERTFTLQGPTKGYETEGTLLTGWIVGPVQYLKILGWLQFYAAHKHFTTVGDHMVLAALTLPFREEYVRQQLKIYYQARDLLWNTLNSYSWIECGKPMGGGFVFPDVSGSGMDEISFTRFCAERGVAPAAGTWYGHKYGKGHVRFAFCSPLVLEKKMNQQLKKTLSEYENLHKDLLIN
jgi:aspartate/methionine/tyrosine aminotransferase